MHCLFSIPLLVLQMFNNYAALGYCAFIEGDVYYCSSSCVVEVRQATTAPFQSATCHPLTHRVGRPDVLDRPTMPPATEVGLCPTKTLLWSIYLSLEESAAGSVFSIKTGRVHLVIKQLQKTPVGCDPVIFATELNRTYRGPFAPMASNRAVLLYQRCFLKSLLQPGFHLR